MVIARAAALGPTNELPRMDPIGTMEANPNGSGAAAR
jgi:hypothetical protein